ncbi:unnamed protein product, partial [Adineta steineri]
MSSFKNSFDDKGNTNNVNPDIISNSTCANSQLRNASVTDCLPLSPSSSMSIPGMDDEEFRRRGKEMIDYIADYLLNIGERRVTSVVEPGYLKQLLPQDAPQTGESWDDIIKDVERVILPGITHWQHSRFHAYFPAGNSYPSILGEMLSSGLGINGFSWATSPACAELETIVLDWLGRMMGLPIGLLPFNSNSDNNDSKAMPNTSYNSSEDREQTGGGVLL